MLGKLIRYEWKGASRACLPVYGAVLVLALVNRLFMIMNNNVTISASGGSFGLSGPVAELPQVIAGFLYFALIVAAFVVTFVILIQRFYKNLLGDEGYLMFTLPVTVSQNIIAKTIVAFILSVLCGITVILSVMVLAMDGISLQNIGNFFSELAQLIARKPVSIAYGLEGIAFVIISGLSGILTTYLCIAIGHLARRHRIAAAVGAYFGLSIVMQIILSVIMQIGYSTDLFRVLTNGMSAEAMIHLMLLSMVVWSAITGAIGFFGTRFILKNHLNLE